MLVKWDSEHDQLHSWLGHETACEQLSSTTHLLPGNFFLYKLLKLSQNYKIKHIK